MVVVRMLVALGVFGLTLPVSAQVFDVFPYETVSAFGRNNERDVNAESCDLVLGCFDQQGRLCGGDPADPNNPNGPDQQCDLQTVPAGRCTSGNNNENVWPSKSGECEGTLGYFERGPSVAGDMQEVSVGGVPCLTDAYRAALADFSQDPNRDSTQVDALETENGSSSMCPGNDTCAHMRCKVAPADTGVVACTSNADCTARADDECIQVNQNSANCQGFDPRPGFCVNHPEVPCGTDGDCPKFCVNGPFDGEPCISSLTECGAADEYCVGGSNHNGVCNLNGDCPGEEAACVTPVCVTIDTCGTSGNDFEPGVCGGTQARCSDGDPDLEFGGLGTTLCTDFLIFREPRIDGQQNCGRNTGTEELASPRNAIENPVFLFTPQRDPGTGFQGSGAIRRVRTTAAVAVQTAADAVANNLGIRSIRILGDSAWQDAGYSADDVNGNIDLIRIEMRCAPPQQWETQLPVEGSCSNDPNTFCVEDDDCSTGTCENLFFCHERRDPNNPALGPALDSVGFLWQRDIVDHEPVPAELVDRWSTDPSQPTCPPLCGTAYDHTTLESEAIRNVGLQDRASGIQLALDSLSGRRAGAADFLTIDAAWIVEWGFIGDIRCQLGGQDPNDLVNLGTCTASRVPCDPDNPVDCASVETCKACGGRLIRAGDPLAATKGLNPQALPIGYDHRGFDTLKLIENRRLGVKNNRPAMDHIPFFVVGTTGAAAAQFTDQPPCHPTGDRCLLGQTPEEQPGGVGIGTGGSFAAGQQFAHGGTNRSGSDVTWPSENPPGPGSPPYVRAGSFGVGADGIPGCMGNNSPRNNATNACLKRLGRGAEVAQPDLNSTKARWGFCVDPTPPADWEPEPPPACEAALAFFHCGIISGSDAFCPVDPNSLGFTPGADDIEILTPVEDPNIPVEGTRARFKVSNPSAPAPTLHWASATTVRDHDVLLSPPFLPGHNDFVLKNDTTLCPVDTQTGAFECFSATGCDDSDGDTICDDADNCIYVANAGQEDCCTPGSSSTSNPDGIGDACQCGDVTGDGQANSFDATMIRRQAIGLSAPLFNFPDNCDVTGDRACNSLDATMITRKALGLSAPVFGNDCPNFTGSP